MNTLPLWVCAALLPAAAAPTSSNLVANPGFEELDARQKPAHWTLDGKLSRMVTEGAHSGRRAVRIEDRSTKDGCSIRSALFPVEPGKSYTCSAWAFFVDGAGLGLYLDFYDERQRPLTSKDKSQRQVVKSMSSGTKRWRNTVFSATVPADARYASVWLHSYSGSTLTAVVDDVSVTLGASSPTPEDNPIKPFTPVALQVPGPQRPAVLLGKEEVPKILAKVQSQAWAKAAYESLIRSAESWTNRQIDWPERGGQWSHWYACQVDGARLTARSPTEHVCKKCQRVYTGEPYDSVPLTAMHDRLAQAAQDLALAWTLTNKPEYAAKAREVLLGYAQRYQHYALHDRNGGQARSAGRVLSQTLEEAIWLIPVACAYDMLHPFLDEAARQKIEDDLLRPAVEVIRRNNAHLSNWQSWHNAGVAAAALALRDQTLLEAAINGPSGFQFQMLNSVQDDGCWYEGAWGYHFYALSAHVHLAEMVARAGTDLFQNPRLRSMFDAPLRMMMPNGRLPAFNDSHESGAVGSVLFESAFTHWSDPNYAWARANSSRRDWRSLLYGVAELPTPNAPSLQSCNFTSTGIAVLRAGNSTEGPYLALDYGPHGGGHGHPDKLGFVFYGLGRTLALDPGCVAYGLKVHRNWYKQTVAHNTIVVEGGSQDESTGQCLYFAAAPAVSAVQATADQAYAGVKMARTALLTDKYLLLLDELASDGPQTYDWVYHNYGRLAVDAGVTLTEQSGPLDEDAGYQYLTDVRRGKTKSLSENHHGHVGRPSETELPTGFRTGSNKPWGATWTLDDETPAGKSKRLEKAETPNALRTGPEATRRVRLDMLAPAAEEVITATGPGVTPSEKVPALLVRRREKSTVYCALVQPLQGENQLSCRRLTPITGKQAALEVPIGEGRDVVLAALGRQRVQCIAGSGEGSVSANARLAWFSFQPQATKALLVDGRGLTSRSLSLDVNPATTLYVESAPGRLRVEHRGDEAAGLYLALSRELLGEGGQIHIARVDETGKTLATVRPEMRRGKLEFKLEPHSVYEVRVGEIKSAQGNP